jgi:predicted ATP-dependent endonuclease of OLD family
MQIRRIEISAFRCFKSSIVIEDIGDGVTLLVGDNEEGKSTVLAALQTVLFEKHSVGGTVADAIPGVRIRIKVYHPNTTHEHGDTGHAASGPQLQGIAFGICDHVVAPVGLD